MGHHLFWASLVTKPAVHHLQDTRAVINGHHSLALQWLIGQEGRSWRAVAGEGYASDRLWCLIDELIVGEATIAIHVVVPKKGQHLHRHTGCHLQLQRQWLASPVVATAVCGLDVVSLSLIHI